ncbi:MAG: TonB-dependent receptor [Acidobacteria bacterium]|nr:TonB-dependent receptor [Acidobacteriota bacterium]
MGRFLTAVLFSLSPLWAQNAVVSGRVADATQAVVPGASVEIINTRTNVSNRTTTNAEGYYTFPPLAPGVYELSASSAGFKVARVPNITLEIGQQRVIALVLQPGEVRESITVSEEAPLLVVSRADRGTLVENQFVKSIPLNTRNPLFLLTLTPGVTTGRLAGDNTASQSTTNNFRINGGRGGTNEIVIDGAANTGTYNNQVSAIPQVDAIQEFKVNTSPYAPEFGRTGGGLISFAIKSGTNDFHGSVHEFLRNYVLDANGFNANRAGRPRSSFRRNQFGGTAGGPFWIPRIYNGRNRTFFFFSYEGLRERSLNAYTGTVPAETERRGDFSRTLDTNGALIRIFDPRTTRLDPDRPPGVTRYIRDVFPGNVIPSNLLGTYARSILSYYPTPNQPGLGLSNTSNFFVNAANSLDANRYDLRFDHQLSGSQALFFRYDWFTNINAQPLVYGNFASPVETPNRIPGINWVINHTWTIGAGTIFQHHFSMAQSETNRTPLSFGFDLTTLGLPASAVEGQRVKYFPTTSIGRLTQVGVTGTGYNAVRSRTWQYNANFTWLRGAHTWKAGFDWRLFPVIIDQSSPLGVSASGTFTAGPNPQAAAAGTGHGLADLFLNAPAGISYTLRPIEKHRHPYYAFYVQDEWKLTPRLTLVYGVRYNLELPRTEASNEYVFLDLDSPSPLARQVPGYPNLQGGVGFVGIEGRGRRTQLSDTNNWDPRLGLSWQLNARTVVRTGFGMFHHPLVPNTDLSQGFSRTTSALTAQPDGVTPTYALANPFPQGILKPEGNANGLLTNAGLGISGPVRQQRLPYQSQWSLDIQRQLPWSWVLDVGYAGTAAVALPSGVQYNQISEQDMALGTALNQTVPNPFFGVISDPSSTLSRSTVQRGQLLRPYPHFTSMSGSQAPAGHSTYHGLQVRVERRYSSGLAVLFAYTKSKLMDNTGDFGGFLGPGGFNSNRCFPCDRSLSLQHVPDVARLSFRYDLPFGLGRKHFQHGWQARVLGGWGIASFITWDNGSPINVTGPNDSNSFGGGQRPDATGQRASLDRRTIEDGALYFNPAAFRRAPQFTFGTASRTVPDVRIPGAFGWDALIEKRIAFTERIGVDFRTELFNASNSVVFGGPQTSILSADFGRIRLSQVNLPRQIQFGMRLSF